MSPSPEQIKNVFLAALDKTVSEERSAFLDAACAGDLPLRRCVEAMLKVHDQPDALLDRPAGELLTGHDAQRLSVYGDQPGTLIAGRYKLIEAIGEGGMGMVWLAEQTEPVRRKVALKMIRPGLDSRTVLNRFDAERQALAMMDHPNIAKVLDAGATDDRRPFFVMEYVKGIAITQYCDDARLSIGERLALFVPICQAVQHAHQKGIIHRDLKPSNILVCLYDGVPVPKVIDFGLAKATQAPLTDQSLHTAHGLVLGTPLYMSPEQAELNNLDIDTRSDVYALGVVLYELLTGTTPLERHEFQKAAWMEMQRLIREEEPPRPSDRLSGSGSLPSVAAQRNLEPAKLTKLIRGDLDWIVMKALEKDRARRYDTANGFAEDVTRYLIGEPVVAHPPSRGYRLKKFVRRHRGQVIAASAILTALIAGVAVSTYAMLEARRERDAKEIARKEEAEQRALAEARLDKLDRGLTILGSVFGNIDPKAEAKGGDPLSAAIGKQLDHAANELRGDAIGDPLVVAKLQGILGKSMFGLGRYDQAIEVLNNAITTRTALLGGDHPETMTLRVNLANVLSEQGKQKKALALFEQALPVLTKAWGADDPRVLKIRAQRADVQVALGQVAAAVAALEEVVVGYQTRGTADTRDGLVARNILAHAHLVAGHFAKAIPILEPALPAAEATLGVDHADALILRNNLAMAYLEAGDFKKGLPLIRGTFDALAAKLGVEHPNTLIARSNLAHALNRAGQRQAALEEYERIYKIYELSKGPDHDATLNAGTRLGQSYTTMNQPERAIPLLERVLAARIAQQGPVGADVEFPRSCLASAYSAAGQHEKAIPLHEANLALVAKGPSYKTAEVILQRSNFGHVLRNAGQSEKAIATFEAALSDAVTAIGPDHPATLLVRGGLGFTHLDGGRYAMALPLLKDNLDFAVKKLTNDHPDTIIFRINYAGALRYDGKAEPALAVIELAVEPARNGFGPDHATTIRVLDERCTCLEDMKQWNRALAERKTILELERKRGKENLALSTAVTRLGHTLLRSEKYPEAETVMREAVALEAKLEPGTWGEAQAKSLLGASLACQKKFAEGLPLLRTGYEQMKSNSAKIPPRRKAVLGEARDRLIEGCEAAGDAEEAAKWRKEKS